MISQRLINDGFQMIIKTIYIYIARKNKNLKNEYENNNSVFAVYCVLCINKNNIYISKSTIINKNN